MTPGRAAPGLRRSQLSVLLGLLATVGPYTMDAFFPSLRAIAADFHLTDWQAQQTLTCYMLPYACMALVHGSVSDAIGRRKVVLLGLSVYVLASLGCALAPGFALLLLLRAVQGFVAGAGMIVGRAVVRDRYSGAEAQRLMSVITMIFGVGPALAPVIGGWVQVLWGWRMVFATMALWGAVLLYAVWRWLPETHPPQQRMPLAPRALARHSFMVLRHPEFLLLASGSGLSFISLYIYIGSAPAIILDHWHLRTTDFYALTLPIIGGYMLAAWCSGRLAGRMLPQRQARLGLRVLLVLTAAMALLQALPLAGGAPIYAQQLLMCGIAIGLQLMYPVVALRILDLFAHARGAAASMQSFFSLLFGTVTMGLLAPLLARSLLLLALVSLATAITGWLLWRAAQRYLAVPDPAA